MIEFFQKLVDTSDWPPRWHCGNWTQFHGWLYILSDLLIWAAYFSMPILILKYILQKREVRFYKLYILFAAFILACGSTHFIDAITFWLPVYRLNALIRFITAVISWITVFYLIRYLPIAFSLKSGDSLEADIRERTASLEMSRKETMDYKYALDESSIVAITDQKGIIKYVNENFCRISKYSREELIGQDHRIINSGHHSKEFIRNIWTTIANGKIWKGELKNKAKDGTIYWVDTTIVPFLNEQGKPYQYVAIRADITERKKTEESLDATLREISDYKYALDESSIVAITDQKGIIKYVNENFCRISKYSREELIGQDHRIINSGYHSKEFIRNIWTTIANGKIWKGELKNKAKDGTTYWVDTTIVPFLNEQGKPYQYVAIRADITERKKTEESLDATLREISDYKYALEESSIVAITDQKGIIKYVNENFCRISKYSREELIGQDHRIINSGHHSKEFIRNIWTTIANGKIWKGELKNKAKDGTIYWVDTTIVPFLNEQGKPYQYVAIRADITERKRGEIEILRLNEDLDRKVLERTTELYHSKKQLEETLEQISFLASITENIQDPIITTDQNFTITKWNSTAEKLFEWKSAEVIGKNVSALLGSAHITQALKNLDQGITENNFWQGEDTYSTKSGLLIYVISTLSKIRDVHGNIVGNLILVRDISKRVQAENKLKEFEHFFQNSNDLSGIANTEGYFEIVNPCFEKTLDYSHDELVEKQFLDFIHPDDVASTLLEYENLKMGKEVIHFSNRYRKKDGNYLWFDWNATPNPATGKLYCIARDVTERRKTERALQKLNEELEQRVKERTEVVANTLREKNMILESIGDAFFAVDKDWIVTYWNRIAEEMLGKPKAEIVNKNLWSVFPGSAESASYKKYHEAISTNTVMHFEEQYAALNKWYEVSAYPSANGLSVYFKDVTERKIADDQIKMLNSELEDKVHKRTAQLEAVNKELEAFSYSVSHDLRAPLRAINGYARMLEEDYHSIFDENGKRLLGIVQKNAHQMGALIDDLLSLSRLGRKELQKSMVDMMELTQSILDELSDLDKSNVQLTLNDLHTIQGDRTLLKQVLVNLISNAFKYSSKTKKPIITIRSEKKESEVIYSIADNGSGFDMAYANKLFGVFQRLHSQEEFEGTGVGLAIVKLIIGKHKGRVWAEGVVGKGATFHFSLPTN